MVVSVRNVDDKLKRNGHSVERWTHDDRESYNSLSLAIELEETAQRDNFTNRFSPRLTTRGGWVL